MVFIIHHAVSFQDVPAWRAWGIWYDPKDSLDAVGFLAGGAGTYGVDIGVLAGVLER